LDDPDGLLEGTGKAMRHVKLRPGRAIDCDSLQCLIETAYRDIQRRLRDQQSSWLIHRHHVPAVPGHCGPAIESALEHDPVAPRNEK